MNRIALLGSSPSSQFLRFPPCLIIQYRHVHCVCQGQQGQHFVDFVPGLEFNRLSNILMLLNHTSSG